jgi:hypothetical protein
MQLARWLLMEQVVARFGESVWSQYCMELLRNLSKAIWPSALESNLGFFDYEAGMPITQPRRKFSGLENYFFVMNTFRLS